MTDARDARIDACLREYGRMMHAMLHVRAVSYPAWKEVNLTLPQLRALSLLTSREAGLSGRELAAKLGVGPSAVTPLMDRLVDQGYVRREEDRADRRITRLILTPAGLATLQQMAAGRRELLAEILQRLEPDELAIVERAFELVCIGIERGEQPPTQSPTPSSSTPSSLAVATTACALVPPAKEGVS